MKGKFYSLYGVIFALALALGSPAWAADKSDKDNSDARRTERRDDKASASARQKINLNTADSTTLQTLPGVGPAVADAIIAARPFKSVDDLKNVKGIGDARFEQIRPKVTTTGTRANIGGPASATRGADKASQSPQREVDRTEKPGAAVPANPPSTTRGSDKASQIPQQSEVDRPARTRRASNSEAKVNINTASQAELESLLGIGPVKAQAIIDGRPYQSAAEIKKVKGIKEGTYEEIRDRITVR
jgi:competence protein ComEA